MKFNHRLKSAPNSPDMAASYKARIVDVKFTGGKVICVWTIYTPKIRTKKPALKATKK
jgi:hypothetical protein